MNRQIIIGAILGYAFVWLMWAYGLLIVAVGGPINWSSALQIGLLLSPFGIVFGAAFGSIPNAR